MIADLPSRQPIEIDPENRTIDLAGYTAEDSELSRLATNLFASVKAPAKPKRRYRGPSWRFGVVGDPKGQFIVTPRIRATTQPDVFPYIEPTEEFSILIATQGARLRAVSPAYSSPARITMTSIGPENAAIICAALERTFEAIEARDWDALRPVDRSRCMWCRRRLSEEVSRNCGYGPDCASKYGLAYRGVTTVDTGSVG